MWLCSRTWYPWLCFIQWAFLAGVNIALAGHAFVWWARFGVGPLLGFLVAHAAGCFYTGTRCAYWSHECSIYRHRRRLIRGGFIVQFEA